MIVIWIIMINELASSLCANSQSVPFVIILSYNAQSSLHKGVRVLNPSKLGFAKHSTAEI